MRSLALAIPLALAVALAAAPTFAFPHIDTVACDTLSTNPLRVRTTFNLDLVGPGSWCWFDVEPRPVGPQPADSTHFYDCGAPSGWQCGFFSTPFLHFVLTLKCFGSGEHFLGFSVVANRPAPCARFIFGAPVLLLDDGSYTVEGCLGLDGPVPATPTTWGHIKATYR